jgi:hypothetical protein
MIGRIKVGDIIQEKNSAYDSRILVSEVAPIEDYDVDIWPGFVHGHTVSSSVHIALSFYGKVRPLGMCPWEQLPQHMKDHHLKWELVKEEGN